MRVQLNVRIAKRLKRLVDNDKSSSGKTNDIIAEVALESFFSKFSPEERVKFYKNHDRSPYARA